MKSLAFTNIKTLNRCKKKATYWGLCSVHKKYLIYYIFTLITFITGLVTSILSMVEHATKETTIDYVQLMKLAKDYYETEDYKTALPYFEKVYKWEADYPSIRFFYGGSLLELGHFQQAIIVFEGMSEKEKIEKNVYYYLGFLYEFQDEMDMAKKSFEEYLENTTRTADLGYWISKARVIYYKNRFGNSTQFSKEIRNFKSEFYTEEKRKNSYTITRGTDSIKLHNTEENISASKAGNASLFYLSSKLFIMQMKEKDYESSLKTAIKSFNSDFWPTQIGKVNFKDELFRFLLQCVTSSWHYRKSMPYKENDLLFKRFISAINNFEKKQRERTKNGELNETTSFLLELLTASNGSSIFLESLISLKADKH